MPHAPERLSQPPICNRPSLVARPCLVGCGILFSLCATLGSAVVYYGFGPCRTSPERAENTAIEIERGCVSFRVMYAILPDQPPGSVAEDLPSDAARSDRILAILKGDNPKEKIFFESMQMDSRELDPWGMPYRILLDDNRDGLVTYQGEQVKTQNGVLVVSGGIDRRFEALSKKWGNDDLVAGWADMPVK